MTSTLPRPETGRGTAVRAGWRAGWRQRPGDPVWARPALLVLLAATGVLYVWGLGASGWANAFYSAAVQAGATSWKAFFFGSSDAVGAITVDKTPAALWPMELSARIFGVNSWSILVPQALMGVATVALLYAAVRRTLGRTPASVVPALLAGAAMALTPVAALMFRFNNPDALLVLLLTGAAYALVRAQERGSTRWMAVCGALVGLGFLAKMMQAFLVVPVFALVYLVTAPVAVRQRIVQVLVAGAAMVVAAGWWLLAVALTPAGSRPYIGGSQHNSVLELALGYNGIGRLNGNETGGLGNLNQDSGLLRMFGSASGGQISWLLPAALVLLVAGLAATYRAARTDRVRAGLLVWGGWLLLTGLVFSFMQGIFHDYYTVALAPAIAALVGIGAGVLWERRWTPVLAGAVAVSAWWAYVLLSRTPDWHGWLRPLVLVAGLGLAAALAAGRFLPERVVAVAGGAAALVLLVAPGAYALDTVQTPHTGAIVTAGPSTGGGFGGMRGGGPRGGWNGGGQGMRGGGFGGMPPGGGTGTGQNQNGQSNQSQNGGNPFGGGFRPGGGGQGGPGGGGGGGRGGGPGGLLNAATPSAQATAALKANASAYTWAAATVGSNNAAGYQLATGLPVMAIGGFNGTDPAPTLARFQRLVSDKKIHYFVGGGSGGGMAGRASSGSDAAQRISEWVAANFTATTVGGVTMYDLTAAR
ncbi:glycosyltransferase family 39 protein [Actinomadura parmotrematis]|uniref:Glycosyltransferase family 39 protein n=1 Tax=Actinomadura parmotrematis TaxID=2864039 RepID=A0ABS7FQC6_9ACTN|nr:glycosyltransferase family 39 protein [Actinomadura parmotrematis]MBW8482571.1 glycosyltransferase family 39 protein [Actinomadura parmotrematis]